MSVFKLFRSNASKNVSIHLIGKFFVIPNYQYYDQKYRIFYSQKTPLVTMTVGNYEFGKNYIIKPKIITPQTKNINSNNPKLFISFSAEGHCNAYIKILINKNRQKCLQILNTSDIQLYNNSIISIKLKSVCNLATETQIGHHLKQLIKDFTKNIGKNKNKNNKVIIKDNPEIKTILKYLFDFKLQRWVALRVLCAKDNELWYISQTQTSGFVFAHYFKIKNSLNLYELSTDIRDFCLFLQKMNLIDFLSDMFPQNEAKFEQKCVKLIRIMKWRTIETQQYLIFYLRHFNRKQLLSNLKLFSYIAIHYSQEQKKRQK